MVEFHPGTTCLRVPAPGNMCGDQHRQTLQNMGNFIIKLTSFSIAGEGKDKIYTDTPSNIDLYLAFSRMWSSLSVWSSGY